LTITVYPYKLTQKELEARLESGLTVLPGQLVRFESAQSGNAPVYGQVREVRALPPASAGMPEGYGVVIALLHGCPTLEPQSVSLLDSSQMALELQRLQQPFEHPLRLTGTLIGELDRLGTLSLVDGHDFVLKYETLMRVLEAVRPYKKLLIIDPLGVFEADDGFAYYKAGSDVQLSLQSVGSKRFLSAFGELFAPDLKEQALRVVADQLPLFSGFIAFQELLNSDAADNVPLKNLILQNYQTVAQSQVFADTPQTALDIVQLSGAPVGVLDVSELTEPWKRLFYEQACQMVLESDAVAQDDLIMVLLYPENYVDDLTPLIQRAEETGLNLLILTSPYAPKAVRKLANNRFYADSRQHVELQGDLTLGLPVRFALSLSETLEREPLPPVASSQPLPDMPIPSSIEAEWLPNVEAKAKATHEPQMVDVEMQLPPSSAPPRNSAEQAWWFEVSQPVTEDEIVPQEEPFEEAEPEDVTGEAPLGTINEATGPIVDLSAPEPEPTISFLTAEQLSALLGSSEQEATHGGPQPLAQWEDVVEMPTEPQDTLDYPDADEGAWSDYETAEATSSELWDLAPPASDRPKAEPTAEFEAQPEVPAKAQSDEAQRMETAPVQPAEQPISEEGASAPQEPGSGPAPPPFPTPEEYRKEEFDFELNLDERSVEPEAEGEGSYSSYLAEGELLPNAVAQSLSEFEELDQGAADESLFDFEPDLYAAPPVAAEPSVQAAGKDSAPPQGILDSDSSDAERDMQEALDLIFPHEFVDTHPEAQQAIPDNTLPPTAAAPAGNADVEMVPIIPKQVEPSVEDQMGFQVGDRVRHPSYGAGVVQRIIPMEESVVLNITFETVGKRLLDPALCELQREPG
jgi:hypothetical protein